MYFYFVILHCQNNRYMNRDRNNESESVKVSIPGTTKSYEISKLGNAQLVKVCRLLVSRAGYDADDPLSAIVNDDKLACKVAAAIVIRGFFTMRLKWWLLWRWFYYVRQYDVMQLNELLSEGVSALPYSETLNTYSMLSATREMLLHMTFAEAQRLLDASPLSKQVEQLEKDKSEESGKV